VLVLLGDDSVLVPSEGASSSAATMVRGCPSRMAQLLSQLCSFFGAGEARASVLSVAVARVLNRPVPNIGIADIMT